MNEPPPLSFEDDDLFAVPPPKRPATRRDDYATSKAAADKAEKGQATIRQTVLFFAEEAAEAGFIDDDLVTRFAGDGPESSWRKRRGELMEERWLIDTGRTRTNRHGNQETVWVHRNHAVAPTPIVERNKPTTRAAPSDLKARGKATADEMLKWSRSMTNEGRVMFAQGLKDAADLMRLLSL